MKTQGKVTKVLEVILGLIIVVGLILFFLYEKGYTGRVTVNGKSLAFIKYNQIDDYVEDVLDATDYVFDNKDLDSFTVTYNFVVNDAFSNRTFLTFLKEVFVGDSFDFEVVKLIDTDKVVVWLNEYNKTKTQPVSAYIDKNSVFEIVKEKEGTSIDINAILSELTPYTYKHICLDDYILQPSITSNDLESICNEANAYATWSCTYTNGETISSSIDKVWIDDTIGVIYDDGFIDESVRQHTATYNEKPESFDFLTHEKETIAVKNQTLYAMVDEEAEIAYLKDAFKAKETLTARTPCMAVDYTKFSNTYVEVDETQQHLWYYVDGYVKFDCDVVTGQKGRHDTPCGVFYISEKRTNYTMHGTNDDGSKYSSFCKRFMRLTNTGIALHDASWRGSFGGNIYQRDGSHGCVNMPKQKVSELFDMVDIGTVVVIHE